MRTVGSDSRSLVDTLTHLDLPIRLGEDAGAVFDAAVEVVDKDWHLARVDSTMGGSLWMKDSGLPVGQQVRVRAGRRMLPVRLTKRAAAR